MWPLARPGLRVLVYHKVSDTVADPLTVTTAQLDAQLAWLQAQGSRFVTVADVARSLDAGPALDRRSVLVTFDDGYVDTLTLARPVLDRHHVRAAVFVPTAFVGGRSSWDRDARPLMNPAQLRELADAGWELGLHSHRHLNYREIDAAAIEADVEANLAAFRELGLTPVPAIAYAYGRRPARASDRRRMQEALRACGVRLGFRLGNRVNRLPLTAPFEINRLDIRGDRSPGAFARKIRWGRLL